MSVTRGKGKKKLPLKSKMKEVVRFCISDELISCPGMWRMNDCFESAAFFMNSAEMETKRYDRLSPLPPTYEAAAIMQFVMESNHPFLVLFFMDAK